MQHHVYFWLKEDFLNDPQRKQFEQALDNLVAIDGVVRGSWGIPAAVPDRPVVDKSFHYALSLEFETVAEHDAYQQADGHKEFLNQFSTWWKKVQIYDHE